MSTRSATTSPSVARGRRCVSLASLVLMLLHLPVCLYGQQAQHVTVTSSFRWPSTLGAVASSNRAGKAQIQEFFDTVRNALPGAGGHPGTVPISQFRFARLGEAEVCLVVTSGERFPWFLDVICPAEHGFTDTGLMDERMGLLATDLLDLDGDGLAEVISSRFAAGYQGAFSPPIYWYTIYSFKDGLPHDVSQQFRDFYYANVLAWGVTLERLIEPPLGSGSKETERLEAQIIFTRLKYQRKILGESKAGLQEASVWAESSDPSLQELALTTAREINDPASFALIKGLTASKYQGVCREAVGALAAIEHREVTGQELESRCKAR